MPIDGYKIIQAVMEGSRIRESKGIIPIFGVYLSLFFVRYYNRLSFEFEKRLGEDRGPEAAAYLAGKTAHLRIFNDAQGKMNLSLLESGGAALVISQFTLYGDTRRGRRPGFDAAAPAPEAARLYEEYARSLRSLGVPVETGVFQAHMQVELVNDGPVTILLDSNREF